MNLDSLKNSEAPLYNHGISEAVPHSRVKAGDPVPP